MAGKNKFESGNDFSFDDSLDIPEFKAFGEHDEKRNARQVALSLSKGVLKGAIGTQGLLDDSYWRRTIRSDLPKGYGTALDIADEASSTLKSLYHETAKELKPLMNDMKRVVQRMEDPIDKYLPKGLADKMKKWGRSIEPGASYVDAEAQREAMLQAQVAEVLKHQVVSEAKRQQSEDSRSKIREGIDQIRHKDSMGQLNAIRLSVAQLAAYQNNVTASYHRKSLELQYRSFYALRDMVVEQRRMNELTTEAYQKIIKNTGLPEYVKITESERLKQMARNKFMGALDSFGGGLLGARGDFIRKTGENLRKVMSQRVKDFAWGASQGLQGLESTADIMSLAEMTGMRPEEILVQGASGMAAQAAGTRAIQWLKKKLPKDGRAGEFLRRGGRLGNMVQYHATNLPGKARDWAQGFDDLPGWFRHVPGPLQDMLRDAIMMNGGLDRTIQKDRLKDMQGPAIFSRQVAKSITEVIPGYLSRIFRELQVMRTGDEGIELTHYDYMSNKFSSKSAVRKKLFETVIDKSNSQVLNSDMEGLLNEIDPDKRLSPGARAALRKQLLRDNLHNRSGSTEQYTDSFNHHFGHGTELANHFAQRYGKEGDADFSKRVQFATKHTAIGQGIKLAREEIQDLVNAGLLDEVEGLGLVDKFGNIDIDRIANYHLDNHQAPDQGLRSALRRASRKRGGAQAGMRGAGVRHATTNVFHSAPSYEAQYDRSTAGGRDFAEVVDAIKANNNLTVLEKVNQTLLRIEEEIARGVLVYNGGDLGGPGMMGAPRPGGPGGPGFWDRSLRQNWRAGKETARGLGQRAWQWWKQPGWGSAQWNKRQEHWGSVTGKVGGWWQAAKDKWQGMKEVYIEGELKPRLTAWGFKAGMYYDGPITDAKRKVIQTWKDIKGAVYDEEGNLILDPQQAAHAFIRTTAGKKLLAVKNWVVDKSKQLFSQARSGGLSAYGAVRAGLNKAQEYLDAQDVFTKDDLVTPKLQAVIMRARGYRSVHRPEKYVMTPGDIDGPVMDLKGEQVLTDNHLRIGVCDRYGRPLLTGKLRLLQFGKDTMQMAFQKVQNGWNMAKEFLSGKWAGFKNWFKIDGIAFSGGKTIIERLTEIRDLLKERLPGRRRVLGDINGDGLREGSYEDEVKKGLAGSVAHGASAADVERAAAQKFGAGGMSIFGAAGAGFKSLMDAWRRRKGDVADAAGNGVSKLATYGGLAADALALIPGGKILRGAGRGLWGALRGGGRLAGQGLEAGGDLLKAANAARMGGQAGFVGTAEAWRAAKGIKAAQEAEEILQAARAAGLSAEEAEALAADALHGGKAAEAVGLGKSVRGKILSLLKRGGSAAWKGAGSFYEMNRAGNVSTARLAGRGFGMLGRGVGAGLRLGARGLWGAGKLGVTKGLPWLARDLSKNGLRMGGMLGRGALGLARAGGGLGLGLGVDLAAHYANTHGHHGIGSALGTAGTAITGYGLASTAAGLMGIEGGALGLGGAILGAVGAPVLLGAGLLAAGAYGAYKLYKYTNRKKLTELSNLRYIQYGFSPKDEAHADAIFKLEDMLEPNVQFHVSGVPTLTNRGLKEEDLLAPFGVDIDDKEQKQKWLQWFSLRFKPVFLVHMQAMRRVSEQAKSLREVESFKPAQKKMYVQVASYPGGPYKYMTAPFPHMDGLETSDADVAQYTKTLMASVEAKAKQDPDAAKQPASMPKAQTVAQVQAEATTAQGMGLKGNRTNWQPLKDLAGAAVGAQAGASVAGTLITMKGNFDAAHLTTGSTLDGLSTIRFKTYGLKDMNIEKVKTLLVLENAVMKDIDIGSNFHATYKGDIKRTFAEQAPAFGVNGPASTDAYDWIAWFNLRFMPTFLNYLSAVCSTAKKSDPRAAVLALKADQMLEVAAAIRTSHGKNGSVWAVMQMPWPKYEANTGVSSTDENYAGLQERATKTKLDEIKGVPGAGETDSTKGSAAGSTQQSWLSKKWSELTTGADGKQNWLGRAASAVGNAFGGVGKSYSDAAGAGAYGAGQGAAIQATTSGTGGSVNSLPDPKGDGSWAALKDLILAASKMVGVDPKLMAVMAAIESGFRATVKAGTSTATGLYQFITGTWNDVVKKYGPKYGILPGTPRTNPKANALMGAEFTKENISILSRGLGRQPTAGEVYAAHFLGAGTALKLFQSNQSQIAAQVLPQQASANRNIFYEGARARTVGEVIQYLNGLVSSKGAKFGIGTAGGEQLTASDAGSMAGKPPSATGATSLGVTTTRGDTGGDRFSAPGSASMGPSVGTGAPMGYGGSSGPAADTAAAVGAGRTVFDAMGGAGKPVTPSVSNAPSAAPQDPFAVPSMGSGAAMGTGFSPDAARSATDLLASRRAQQAASQVTVPDGGLAAQQLSVSKEMLAQLQLLVKYAAQSVNQDQKTAALQQPTGNDSDSMQSTIAARKAFNNQPQPMKRSPVSMAKPNFNT